MRLSIFFGLWVIVCHSEIRAGFVGNTGTFDGGRVVVCGGGGYPVSEYERKSIGTERGVVVKFMGGTDMGGRDGGERLLLLTYI
jgi:hypothetical protein